MQNNYKNLKKAALVRPFDEIQLGIVEIDLGTLEVNLGSIEIDSGSMESTINWQESAKADVQRKIEKLKNAWETVKNLNAPSEITIVNVDYAMRMANSEVEAAGTRRLQVEKQCSEYLKKAQKLLNDATIYVAGLEATE